MQKHFKLHQGVIVFVFFLLLQMFVDGCVMKIVSFLSFVMPPPNLFYHHAMCMSFKNHRIIDRDSD